MPPDASSRIDDTTDVTPFAEHRERRRAALAATVVAALVVAGVAFAVTRAVHESVNPPDVVLPPASSSLHSGAIAPVDFTLPRLGGSGTLSLADVARGHVTIVNFFASWCTACQVELTAFAHTARTYGDRVTFIGIDTDDTDPKSALALARHAGVPYALVRDASSRGASTAYGITALPVTFVIDRAGRVRAEILGSATEGTLTRVLRPLTTPAPR
jgi:cytochrome c biogenesis protein CcmG/thiol:disulfide interchange protein DsbE